MNTKRFLYITLERLTIIIIFTVLSLVSVSAATQIDLTGPVGSYSFGTTVKALPNGNILVTDPSYDITSPTTIYDAGAVFLYNGRTKALISKLTGTHDYAQVGNQITVLTNGNFVITGSVWSDTSNALMGGAMLCSGETGCNGTMSAANSLVGNKPDDYVPGGITALSNGNYLVSSPSWDNGSIVDAGAVTFCSGTTGCVGTVSVENSLVGGNAGDQTGSNIDPAPRGIVTFPNGNYAVSNIKWNGGRGAVTFGNGATGVTGVVSSANSLVGSSPGDMVGYGNPNRIGVTILANNNYVVSSAGWSKGLGAATFCGGAAGCTGAVSAANSLVGRNAYDYVGSDVSAFPNGSYVVISTNWDFTPIQSDAGAVTFCNGATACIGTVSPENSLVGSNHNDRIGEFGVQALANGNFVVKSPSWESSRGAVTFGKGTTGISGIVSPNNSLVGILRSDAPPDRVGERYLAALANGNYAVASSLWFNGRGAVTFANGNTGITGEISATNSLIGSNPDDRVGTYAIALTTGNYVFASWLNGRGAATFCNGTTGCIGGISPANSLVGNVDDKISTSYQSLKALANGNYLVISEYWNNKRGAVTWGNGTIGSVGAVSAANSIVGSTPGDQVGTEGVVELSNSNYVINSRLWSSGSISSVGAITWGNGFTGTNGEVSPLNSLIGSHTYDIIGFDSFNQGRGGGIYPLRDGNYIVHSRFWDNGSIHDAAAVTLGKGNSPTPGIISADNSVRGTLTNYRRYSFDYDYLNKQMVVGRVDSNMVSFFRYDPINTLYDFDGDGKTDISIFRPSVGEWWYSRSSDGGNYAAQFGNSTDKLVPGDFTGDGRADIAVFRPSTGEWFILRSEDGSYYSFPFGTTGDIPAVGDFDGDGKSDSAVFRPSDTTWYIRRSSDSGFTIQQFGASGDVPVVSDYDGDGKSDIAIWRASVGEWWIQKSSNASVVAFQFGNSADKPVQGDYTGDGKADVAIFRPSSGEWFILRSEDFSYYSFPFGANGDIPAPSDYDGDGKFDATVFRPSGSTWYVQRSTAGTLIQSFGITGDMPVPNAFVP